MDTEEFRRHAHAFVDWMADYLRDVERYPVRAQVKPGEIAAGLAPAPPQDGEPMDTIFADFQAASAPRHHALAAPVLPRLLPGQ